MTAIGLERMPAAPMIFSLFSALDAYRRVGNRVEPRLGDRSVALDAAPEIATVDALQGCFNQTERVFLSLHQPQGKLLLEVVAAELGHVDRHGIAIAALHARFPQGDFGHRRDIAAQAGTNSVKFFPVCKRFGFLHRWFSKVHRHFAGEFGHSGEDPLFYVQMFGMSSVRRTGRDGHCSVAATQRVK
jgi:hypothetical protein